VTASRDFRRVGVLNRGHVALRFIHSAREFNREHGTDIRTIALATDADRGARFVDEADQVVWLGDPFFVDPRDHRAKSRYLDFRSVREALAAANADAAWLGWAFVAEQLEYAAMCDAGGMRLLGPGPAALRLLRDKQRTKALAVSLGIPVLPSPERSFTSVADVRRHAEACDFPIVVKANLGGAGIGVAVASTAAELEAAFVRISSDAERRFGDPRCYLETYLPGARLISVEILADSHGTIWDVGVREGSVQRAFAKVIDEAPPIGLSATLERQARDAGIAIMRAAGYEGVGAVEFLLDAAGSRIWFLEVNARLETAHDVLEATTGIDLVKQEIFVARGGALSGPPPAQRGHAFQVRLQARDPENEFCPATGTIALFRPPMGPGLRVEASGEDGDEMPAGLGTHIAKIVAHGRTRTEALARLERGLRDTTVVVRGGTTNKSFLLSVAQRSEIRSGEVDVDWLDTVLARGALTSDEHAGAALLVAAVEVYEAEARDERTAFLASAARGRPTVRPEVTRSVELFYRGDRYRFTVARRSPEAYELALADRRISVRYQHRGPLERRLTGEGGRSLRAVVSAEENHFAVEVEGVAHRVRPQSGGMIRAPAPGVVQTIAAKVGGRVAKGDVLLLLEAMKMELAIAAPFAGRVRSVHALPNVPVSTGAPLVFLEIDEELARGEAPALDLFDAAELAPVGQVSPKESYARAMDSLRHAMLGYDVEAGEVRSILAGLPSQIGALRGEDAYVLRLEQQLLAVFVDLVSLFRRRRSALDAPEGEDDGAEERLITFLRTRSPTTGGLPPQFRAELGVALAHYGVQGLEPSPMIDEALYWIFRSRQRFALLLDPVVQILERWLSLEEAPADLAVSLLERIAAAARGRHEALADLAVEVSYRLFARPVFVAARRRALADAVLHLASLVREERPEEHIRALVEAPYPLFEIFAGRVDRASPIERQWMLEALTARHYPARGPRSFELRRAAHGDPLLETVVANVDGTMARLFSAFASFDALTDEAGEIAAIASRAENAAPFVVDLFLQSSRATAPDEIATVLVSSLGSIAWPSSFDRATVLVSMGDDTVRAECFTFRLTDGVLAEERVLRGIHPTSPTRLRLTQLREFSIERLPAARDIHLFRGVAKKNPRDERLFAFAEVDLTAVRRADGTLAQLPHFERVCQEAFASLRSAQALRPAAQRLHWNRVELDAIRPTELGVNDFRGLSAMLLSSAAGAGLEKVLVRARFIDAPGAEPVARVVEIRRLAGAGFDVDVRPDDDAPIARLTEYEQKVVRARQRGLMYPHEVIRLLTSDPAAPATARGGDRGGARLPPGDFVEYDLVGGELAPANRPPGLNSANIIVGRIRNFTTKYPEGMTRIVLLGDPSNNLGALAEPECQRILAALALARSMKVPVEWFALSSGAKIAMDSGTENMDWIAAVLRGLIEFTQDGGEVNVLVMGINVGGQPYWNAEATMLLHTRGILVMMPESAMVLTGKRALDYSGGVSAEDDFGIGGYERIMGVNGQAQYFAADVVEACRILCRHYDHTYVFPGERFPRRVTTTDPFERDIGLMPHGGELATVADVFSAEKNPGRKKPFQIRKVMAAAIDQDHEPLERWRDMRDAENAVVWDAHLGGFPVCLLGIASAPTPRRGPIPADGPENFTGGTLFPLASKKIARAIRAASGVVPVVFLANLSGFDGSPESMRSWQLEFGAEIGRSVVNFKGPIVFCVISRFHGGAYVVFSRTLNENLEVAALEGTFASVIGGAPAAGVVFASEVDARAKADPRVKALANELALASDEDRHARKADLDECLRAIRAEEVGKLAAEFDREHSIERALRVGSLHAIITPRSIRPYLIDALERGIARTLESSERGAC
jgi:acetyl/propionyl-CoA carboxylase alpha subunit/acetyl-CoA carboxylase carboxyltransferase component